MQGRDSGGPVDEGFTLVELLVTLTLMGLMMALAVGGFAAWADSSGHVGTARELQTVMRQAQQRAVTEGRAHCVLFDTASDTYTVYRGSCSSTTKVQLTGPHRTASEKVYLQTPVFTDTTGASAGATFYARGTASPGEIRVTRAGSSKVYRIDVEGLTGRVSLD